MGWKIEVRPTEEKYYLRLGKGIRKRIKEALRELDGADEPFLHPNVRPLTGKLQGDYRLSVGRWRLLFTPDREKGMIYVYAILLWANAYQGPLLSTPSPKRNKLAFVNPPQFH